MKFTPPLTEAVFLRRYKRFLADVVIDGVETTVHCPNTGSMKNCMAESQPCWLSLSANPKRKYAHTWELATGPGGDLIGVHSGQANKLVEEAIAADVIEPLRGYQQCRREVRYGQENSRIDLLLQQGRHDSRDCYVEVKSMTLMRQPGLGEFPDAVSQRGSKHIRELMAMMAVGHRAVLLFCVQHSGIKSASIAADIDPVYSHTLAGAVAAGLEVYVYACELSPAEIAINRALEFKLPPR